MKDDFKDLDSYARTRGPAYPNITFELICHEVIGKKQMQQLKKLVGFKVKRHPKYNLPETRLVAIEQHIQSRAIQLMRLPLAHQYFAYFCYQVVKILLTLLFCFVCWVNSSIFYILQL